MNINKYLEILETSDAQTIYETFELYGVLSH